MHMSLHNSFSGAIATLGGWEAMMADIAIFAEAVGGQTINLVEKVGIA